jgi:glycosyltransferase involved in cell wall biosynthesis
MKGELLRVCYFGTFRDSYSRNQIMIEGLRRNDVEVVVCHQRLWHGIEDRVQAASGGWLHPRFLVHAARTYWRLLRAYAQVGDYDVMVLGYPGQLDVFLARLLTWLRRKPLVLDVFMSLYLIAFERGLTSGHAVTGRLIHRLEHIACRLPDLLILDTPAYVRWFQERYGLDPGRFRLVPTGADDRVFFPVGSDRRPDGMFRVLYYGTFIPNHGVDQIVEAARILKNEPHIHFELAGEGPAKAEAVARVQEYALTNVSFPGWLDQPALRRTAAEADLCLGAFGLTPQSMMTVQNKIYEGLAMGRVVVTGDSPTVREALCHGEQVYLCQRDDPKDLARSIRQLYGDPQLRHHLAGAGHRRFQEEFSLAVNGRRFLAHLLELLEARERR